ncbi:FimV-like protein [Hydrogenivirga caldilitoris]|uniref:FimV-like protein n=1 Tax=Hydrogenivirga caldilitoris TaxID=246264 RepID=A0A497XLY5_9AQUI|nr:tetratricopeptide repeat protein [Hydrogenivirga caldilitoris]RLJ69845.1 FimV-like protein [Hydrogenivirga caldilitoris]
MRKLLSLLLAGLLISCSAKQEQSKQEEWRYLYDLGMSAYYAKNYSEAIARLYKAAKLAPQEPTIWNALGITYMEVEEYSKAEEAFKKALESNPNNSEAKMNLGILYLKMGDHQRAVNFLQEALSDETFDKKHIAFYYMAKVYKETGDREKYIEYLKKATAYNPLFIEAQLELGSAYLDDKRYEEAERLFKTLISNNFKTSEIYLNLARVYYETGDYEKAKESVKLVLEDKQASNLQRTQAYELLSRILVEEQRKSLRRNFVRIKRKHEGKFGIQIAAFSTHQRAETLVEELKAKGLKELEILESSGIYKVIYGRFPDRETAQKELERLRKHQIYGFIVEVE